MYTRKYKIKETTRELALASHTPKDHPYSSLGISSLSIIHCVFSIHVNVIPKRSFILFLPRSSRPAPPFRSPVHIQPPKIEAQRLLSLEQEDGAVAQVEIDKVLSLVSNEGSEVAAYNAMPGRAFALVELGGC
jgi:hypothetical protein